MCSIQTLCNISALPFSLTHFETFDIQIASSEILLNTAARKVNLKEPRREKKAPDVRIYQQAGGLAVTLNRGGGRAHYFNNNYLRQSSKVSHSFEKVET